MGEKTVFIEPVGWESHFQALRGAVSKTFRRDAGHPVAFHLLDILMDVVFLIPRKVREEETRLDFLASEPGEVFSFVFTPPVTWDWERGRPILHREGPELKPSNAPVTLEEATALAAVSKGLGWFIKGGMRGPVLLHGLEGLTPFPTEKLSPIPEGLKADWSMTELITAEDILKGLGSSREEVLNSVMTHGPILPWRVEVGSGGLRTSPRGFPFDEDLTRFLGLDSKAWEGLRFRGEINGQPWESHFTLNCRGLEVNQDTREAYFVIEVSPQWGPQTPPANMFASLTNQADQTAMRAAVMEWGPDEWSSWAKDTSEVLGQTMDLLMEDEPKAKPEGVSSTASVGAVSPHGVEVVEKDLRPASWVSGETRVSTLAQAQLKLFGMKSAPDYRKAKRLPSVLAARLEEGIRAYEAGEKPSWLIASRGRGGGWELSKEEAAKVRASLLEDKAGFIEAGKGGAPQLVIGYKVEKPGGEVEQRERWIAGHGVYFLTRRNRTALREELKREQASLERQVAKLREEVEAALIKPTEDLDLAGKQLAAVWENQGHLTSWDMAMDLLKHLIDEQSSQGRNPIEVEAHAIKDWMWPGKEAPDNWLQTVTETLTLLSMHLTTADVGPRGTLSSGSFIEVDSRLKDAPEKVLTLTETKGVKGVLLVYVIKIQESLLGGMVHLKAGSRALPSGAQATIYETRGKITPTQRKAADAAGERYSIREAHLTVILKGLGCDDAEAALGEHLHSYMTKADTQSAGKWAEKIRKYPDGDIFRHYTSAFQGCHLLPAPGTGFLHGALASLKKAPEEGWYMGGRPKASRHKGGLLHFMGLDLPLGANKAGRRSILLRALKSLRRIVVELGEGVLAVKLDGAWHDLGDPTLSETVALHLLEAGKVFPFLSPGWVDRAKAAYELKAGVKLTGSIKQADATRWETRPAPTETNTLDGLPLYVRLKEAILERKLTQGQAARELGVSPMMVSLWVNEKKPISPESSIKVREWIGVNPQVTLDPPE